jgi:Fur family transcriptional regulator, peroxide stress response regulator
MDRREGTGWKATPQRMAILEYLDGNREHPSAEAVYRAVSAKFPTMSFATVYNTLEGLRRRGGVRELTIDPAKKRFDPNTEPHHHLICVECRRIVDVHVDYGLAVPDPQREDFEIIGNHVEFYGRCSACKAK